MQQKKIFKILIAGSFGSGKTSLVRTLSEIEPLTTEKQISNSQERLFPGKKTTTVALDMGKLKIADDVEIQLFATPGQERFSFMLDILSKGILGALVLVDATNLASIDEAKNIAKKIRELYEIPIVYGITKTDEENAKSFEEIQIHLGNEDDAKIIKLDPRDFESSKRALLELLKLILEQ